LFLRLRGGEIRARLDAEIARLSGAVDVGRSALDRPKKQLSQPQAAFDLSDDEGRQNVEELLRDCGDRHEQLRFFRDHLHLEEEEVFEIDTSNRALIDLLFPFLYVHLPVEALESLKVAAPKLGLVVSLPSPSKG
jgi:hypothetical protein